MSNLNNSASADLFSTVSFGGSCSGGGAGSANRAQSGVSNMPRSARNQNLTTADYMSMQQNPNASPRNTQGDAYTGDDTYGSFDGR